MTEADDEPDDIADLEAEIERLAESAERSRKFIFGSKIAVGAGACLLLATLFGLIAAGAISLLGSIALILAGIVSLGSNVSTLQETEADIADAEAMRARLIGSIGLKLVHDAPMKLM